MGPDDAVQDAFVQAYVKLDTFERASAFYTWLYRIACNLAISQAEAAEAHGLSSNRLAKCKDTSRSIGGAAPGDRLEQQERACQVRAALDRLSDEHRTIMVLREMDGCAYDEIAEILDLPVGTIRSRLHRARLQLRDQLKDTLQEDAK